MGLLSWLDEYDKRFFRRADERRQQDRQRWDERSLAVWLTAVIVPVIVLMSVFLFFTIRNDRADRRVAAVLDRDGETAQGTAIHFRLGLWSSIFFGNSVQVAFQTPDGRTFRPWVPHDKPVRRGPVSIRYLRGDPSVARLVHDPAPREGRWITLVVVHLLLLFLLVIGTLIVRYSRLGSIR